MKLDDLVRNWWIPAAVLGVVYVLVMLSGSDPPTFIEIDGKTDRTGNRMELFSKREPSKVTKDELLAFCQWIKHSKTAEGFYTAVVFDTSENAVFPATQVFSGGYGIDEQEAVRHIVASFSFMNRTGFSELNFEGKTYKIR